MHQVVHHPLLPPLENAPSSEILAKERVRYLRDTLELQSSNPDSSRFIYNQDYVVYPHIIADYESGRIQFINGMSYLYNGNGLIGGPIPAQEALFERHRLQVSADQESSSSNSNDNSSGNQQFQPYDMRNRVILEICNTRETLDNAQYEYAYRKTDDGFRMIDHRVERWGTKREDMRCYSMGGSDPVDKCFMDWLLKGNNIWD